MRPKPKPGFLLVARREWRWLLHDRAALILIFGVPLFAILVLTAAFSHPVIRDLGVVVVDADAELGGHRDVSALGGAHRRRDDLTEQPSLVGQRRAAAARRRGSDRRGV